MILQALYELAEREGFIEDPDFEIVPVAWLIRVGEGGQFLGLTGTHSEKTIHGKKKPIRVAKRFRVPKRLPGRQGSLPPAEFLADNAQFVLGKATADKELSPEKRSAASQRFLVRVRECLSVCGDPAIRAVVKFLEDVHSGRTEINLPEEVKSNEVFAFAYEGDTNNLVSDRKAVVDFWRTERERTGAIGEARICLVSGKRRSLAPKHPKVKSVPGGNSSGAALISFNKSAFESYGWEAHENAQISLEASEACAAALNRLLAAEPTDPRRPGEKLSRRNIKIAADTVVCYWTAKGKSEGFLDALAGLMESNPESVGEAYRSLWKGQPVEISEPDSFYALTLSGAEGRVAIRGWFELTVQEVDRNVSQHFADLQMNARPGRDQAGGMGLKRLLSSLAVGGKEDNLPSQLATRFVDSALTGRPYPDALLQRSVDRSRLEARDLGDSDGKKRWEAEARLEARAAMIKAYLNRRRRRQPERERKTEVRIDMDPNCNEPGYLLGQLMAVLEQLQQAAIGNPNASLVDRYFSGASEAPRNVFVRLLKGSVYHASKAKDDPKSGGKAFLLERMKDEICGRLDVSRGGLPARLDLHQQGYFVLGYHQTRRWLWLSREERRAWESGYDSIPRAYRWGEAKEVIENGEK